MKKVFKRKSASVTVEAQPDIAVVIGEIKQQLDSLERKVDTLVSKSASQPQERPFRDRHFSKPFRSSERSFGHGRERQDDRPRERSFTQVICAECGKECEVPFKPSADRPVYCSDCFSKRKGSDSFKGKRDNSFGGENREFDHRKKPSFRRRK